MANNCYFNMHIISKNSTEGILKILTGISAMDEEELNPKTFEVVHLGRVFSSWCYGKGKRKDNTFYAYADGDCAWSFQSAILDKGLFQQIIRKYKLSVEVYTEEPGVGFAEHYLWTDGELMVDRCVDLSVWSVYDLEEEDLEDFLSDLDVQKAGITKENYLDKADENGDIRVGGFEEVWTVE